MTKGKKIDTLVEDIYGVFTDDAVVISPEEAEGFGKDLSAIISARVTATHDKGHLRMSNAGKPCELQLWYDINQPETAEELPPNARMKFLFGDILECLLLFLAKKAGHTVTGEQEELEIAGVKGHRDAVIDGELVDVKSASKFSFNKFKEGLTPDADGFGYLNQLRNYLFASTDTSSSTRAHFLVINKELGSITLDTHELDTSKVPEVMEHKKQLVASPQAPSRGYTDEADGKSGNRKLKFNCAYCPYKKECWPGLRTFIYSQGPRFLTKVERLPDVPEV